MFRNDRGASLVELLAVLALEGILAGLSAPLSARTLDTGRIRSAAAFLSSRLRLARIDAVNRSANVGVVFDQINGEWVIRTCRDANGNGLRRVDIASGADPCFDGPHQFAAMFPGTDIAVDPRLVGPTGEPGNADPVRSIGLSEGDVSTGRSVSVLHDRFRRQL